MRALVALIFIVACGADAKAPVPIGFTGTCKLAIHRDTSGFSHSFLTADELKSHVTLRIVEDRLTVVHVEVPDNRHTALEEEPDHPLFVGDAAPNVLVDRGGDVDVPMQLRPQDSRGEAQAWDAVVRVRFRDDTAEVVAGLMVVTGACVVDPKK